MTDAGATVLVTGAHGAIGTHVCAALGTSRDGDVAVAVVRDAPRRETPPGLRTVVADLAHPDAIARVIASERPRVVVHLAGMTGGACESDPATASAVNVESTRAIAEALATLDGPRRLVFASSAAVYGVGYEGPIPETAPPRGTSVYARTKIDAEAALLELSAPGGVETVALRIFNVYGPGFESSLVNRLIRASADAPVSLSGGAGVVRDYVHVADVVRAIEAGVAATVPDGFLAVNVGTGVGTSAQELVDLVGRSQPVHVDWAAGGDAPTTNSSVADVTLATRALGVTAAAVADAFHMGQAR